MVISEGHRILPLFLRSQVCGVVEVLVGNLKQVAILQAMLSVKKAWFAI